MKKRITSIVLALMMCIACIPCIATQANAETATKIYTVEDLYAINSNMSGNYILMNDLDFSAATSKGGEWDYMGNGWDPIGSNGIYGGTAFTGTFDGNGYTIKGLRIEINTYPEGLGSNMYVGLFANNGGEISNLTIDKASSVSVSGNNEHIYCGAIAGNNTGDIVNCTNNADVSSTTTTSHSGYTYYSYKEYTGGICGFNDNGEITKCANAGKVMSSVSAYCSSTSQYSSADKLYSYVGGLVGSSTGIIDKSFNIGDISGYTSGTFDGRYSPQSDYIIETVYQGGIVGQADNATVTDSYSLSTVSLAKQGAYPYTAANMAGGIAGTSASNQTTIRNCYVGGSILGGAGIAASNGDCSVENCYYQSGSATTQSGSTALTTGQMKTTTVFNSFDFEDVWLIDVDSDFNYPQLKGNRQDNKHIEYVELASEPTTKEYYANSEIDPTGGTVKVYYKDGSRETKDITSTMLRDYDMSVVGEQEVAVNYRDFVSTYSINIVERPEIDSLTLVSGPNKTEFVKGTAFDFTGAKAKVAYKDGTEETIDITARATEGGNINRLGTQTITYTLLDKSVEFTVKVIPVEIESISVEAMPSQTVFVEGKPVNTDGLVIKAVYNNGEEQIINDYELSELPTSIGKHNIEVSYSGCTTSFEIEIIEKSAVSLNIKNNPNKTEYIIGQSFDPTGMIVEATFDNDDVLEITDYTIGALPDKTGSGKVEIEYQGQKAYVTVTMRAKVLESISVTQLPDKVNYIQDEDFEETGLKVSANWNNGICEEITDYTLSNTSTAKVGKKSVVVLYDGLTTTFEITVVEKSVVSLAVTPPTKTSYIKGEEFDDSGMVVTATYDNGKSETVTVYEVSGFGDSDEETNLITVSYKGKSRSFIVTIHTPASEWAVTTPPTCIEGGMQELHCAECGITLKTEELDAAGHSWSEWETVYAPNCTDKGSQKRTCSVCQLDEFKDVDPKGHSFSDEYTTDLEPSCTAEGSESKHCTECGVSDPDSVRPIAKLSHNLGEWATTKAATCAVAGVRQRTCADCVYFETEEIPATGNHEYGDWETVKEPICTEKGSRERECSICHTVETEEIAAKGHSWKSDYTVDKAATEAAAGSKSIHCSICNAIKPGSSISIAKLAPSEIVDLPTVKISKPKAAKKSATVKWKKVTKKNLKKIKKVEIQYSLDKSFQTGVITKYANAKKTSLKIKKLQPKKKYYVRIRAYTKSGGVVHVSKWSGTKSVKAK